MHLSRILIVLASLATACASAPKAAKTAPAATSPEQRLETRFTVAFPAPQGWSDSPLEPGFDPNVEREVVKEDINGQIIARLHVAATDGTPKVLAARLRDEVIKTAATATDIVGDERKASFSAERTENGRAFAGRATFFVTQETPKLVIGILGGWSTSHDAEGAKAYEDVLKNARLGDRPPRYNMETDIEGLGPLIPIGSGMRDGTPFLTLMDLDTSSKFILMNAPAAGQTLTGFAKTYAEEMRKQGAILQAPVEKDGLVVIAFKAPQANPPAEGKVVVRRYADIGQVGIFVGIWPAPAAASASETLDALVRRSKPKEW